MNSSRQPSFGRRKPGPSWHIDFTHPLARGLVSAWMFNDYGGTTARDAALSPSNGTAAGTTIPTWAPGNFGAFASSHAANFGRWDCGTGTKLDFATAYTGLCWMKTTASTDPDCSLFGKINPGTFAGFMAWFQGARNLISYANGGSRATGATAVTANTWNQMGVSWDGANHFVWVNGKQDGTGSYSTAPTSAGETFRIGGYATTSNSRSFVGQIDHVFLWNRQLSVSEIVWHYNEPFAFVAPAEMQRLYFGPAAAAAGGLFRQGNLSGIGAGGKFFSDPLGA